MSKLNKDILYLLFEELQDDSNSLFSCLLVNKLWCETAVPILWKDPWRFEEIKHKNKFSLFYVISLSFSNEIREFLTSKGIQLPITSNQSLLFDYLTFCRNFHVNGIDYIILISKCTYYKRFLLQQEIYSLLMKKCPEVKSLNMVSLKHQIFYFAGAKFRLESLCELKCDISMNPTFFYGLASICQRIQRLIIDNSGLKPNKGIVKLIEVQRNLRYFEWSDVFVFDSDKIDDVYGEIFLALEGKADTLVHFITSFQDNDYILGVIPIKFSKFYNLKTLIINDSYVEYERQLKHSSYQNLEVFQIDFIKTSTLIYIINNSGGNLSKIIVGGCSYNGDEDLIIIRTIHEKCPLIEYLTLTFSSTDENFMEFEKLLNTCQKLKTLILNIDAFLSEGHSIAEKRLLSGEKLSKALTRSAPFNLRRLVFNGINHDYGPRFSFKTLKDFFENWKGRTSLSIFTPDRHYKAKEYDEMINGYLNDGVIKDFSYNLINYFM